MESLKESGKDEAIIEEYFSHGNFTQQKGGTYMETEQSYQSSCKEGAYRKIAFR